MKSMQRKFGGMMKRSADTAEIGAVIADYKAADEMLDRLLKDITAWRDQWEDILKFQYDAAEAFSTLYKAVEPTADPEQRHRPAETPQQYLTKCMSLQKLHAELRGELAQEVQMIISKVLRPVQEAKGATKGLQKTLKHRENMKLDYERYLSWVEHARKKQNRSVKDETALAKHETDLTQAQIDYQTADEQVKQCFPPVTDAVLQILPGLLASQIMIHTAMVGHMYTVLDAYCKQQGLPSPAPDDATIISTWDREFTGFRKELESDLKTIAYGKASKLSMTLPEKDTSTVSGFGIRNKVMGRDKAEGKLAPPRPIAGRTHSQQSITGSGEEEEEEAPPRPPRPAASPGIPSINLSSKPRIPSGASSPLPSPYGQKPTSRSPSWQNQAPPAYESTEGASPSPASYKTPPSGGTPTPFSMAAGGDYFGLRNGSQTSVASAAAAKKKPPPPIPVKRIPTSQAQYVTALYDFEAQNKGDLPFKEGDRIRVVKKTDSQDDWWDGELRGTVGCFPANYVQL